MKLYIAAGVYVGTQAEAKKLDRDFEPVEVPTDKEGLIAYLNSNWQTCPQDVVGPEPGPSFADEDISDLLGDDEPSPKIITDPALYPKATEPPRSRTFDIEVEEHIQNANAPRLAVLASNVAWRYKEISEELNK